MTGISFLITVETNLFIKPQNVEDNERRCSSCKSRKLRQSINEWKECVNRQNVTSGQLEQHIKVDLDEKTIYNGVAKSFCTCWNDALSVVKKHVWKQQPDTLPFSQWFPKLVELFKQKSKFLEYIYSHVCDYNLNRLNIEINTENILKRQDEILAKVNELKHPITCKVSIDTLQFFFS